MSAHVPPARWTAIRALANKLIGTTGGAIEEEIEALSKAECKVLDTMAVRCVDCEWWVSRHEVKNVPLRGLTCMSCR